MLRSRYIILLHSARYEKTGVARSAWRYMKNRNFTIDPQRTISIRECDKKLLSDNGNAEENFSPLSLSIFYPFLSTSGTLFIAFESTFWYRLSLLRMRFTNNPSFFLHFAFFFWLALFFAFFHYLCKLFRILYI